jgi:beta-phosphoglucomutase
MKTMNIKAVIFDLDGVIVSTDEYHFRGWEKMADEEGIYFDREINERLRGVSRMESLEIILERTSKQYTEKEKIELAERKNCYYRHLLNGLSPKDILPGVTKVIGELKERGVKIAIGSSSKNTPMILDKIRLADCFDAVADGNGIKNSKPDPEVFILAASKLNINPESCLVVEDADAGIEAALAGGMRVLGVGTASMNEKATYKAKNLAEVSLQEVLG